jgi:hypothetical protein
MPVGGMKKDFFFWRTRTNYRSDGKIYYLLNNSVFFNARQLSQYVTLNEQEMDKIDLK